MCKIFITGLAGFLGSHLGDAMLAAGHEVVGIDNLIGGELGNVPTGAKFEIRDCNDFDAVRRLADGCDVAYHCAATAYEGLSVFSPAIVTRNIVGASATVFSGAIAAGVKRIVFCSSMARYGKGSSPPPFREDYEPKPQDPYGIGKVAAEQMLRCLCDTHRVQYVILVPHNIIGPRQKYDDPYRNVASIYLNLMMQGRSPVIYGDGQQQRCFSYVDDCVSCLVKAAFDPRVVNQVVNIGPDEHPMTINQLYEWCAAVTQFSGEPIYMPDRPQEVKIALCSSDKARLILDYQTKTGFAAGLHKMAEFIRAKGPRTFNYHLPVEIVSEITPKTWTDRLY